MNTKFNLKTILPIIGTLILLQSCNIVGNVVHVENDKVTNTRRVKLNELFVTNKRHEASYTQRVDFVKEIDANNQVSYLLYDIVSIPADKFELDKKVYMLIGDEVFTLNTTYEVAENSRNIKHEKSDILLSDSTKTTVVTGFGMDSRRIIKMKHELEQEQIDKMLQAKEIHLRYYSGPNTINSEIEGLRLNRVKKWILK